MIEQNGGGQAGCFTYEGAGFIYKSGDTAIKVKWLEIDTLIAYKADLLTIDEVRLAIFYKNFQLIITEETTGWEEFVSKIKSIFPYIQKNWETQIVQPPFTLNQITLYQRGHYKIFADFQNTDTFGRVRLNTNGALRDIKLIGSKFKEGIYILLDCDEGLQIFGQVKYSIEENIWVAEIDWENFIDNQLID